MSQVSPVVTGPTGITAPMSKITTSRGVEMLGSWSVTYIQLYQSSTFILWFTGLDVQIGAIGMYTNGMDVAVTELRANLRHWLDQVRDGDEVVITERGIPLARIVRVDAMSRIDDLTAQGVIARPERPTRSRASGRELPRAGQSLSEMVSEERR